ncbi:MAG: hypothetical protein JRJ15_08075 [Deltaproteobacteria bacterium]|nr:hypothetical protein [Deltaproteobacteria bacterium]
MDRIIDEDNQLKVKRKEIQMTYFWILLFIGAWILLQAIILPKLGIST